ncbi:MAG: 1-acyl-sn-glycerol-3-phosphate acyltransferase [Deltaproteobacteria bacterium]|nr:1-acyl-sn-glycerol-3-phosphate acyltransferase [Deltaproteobacteria bacterium]MCB9785300.1 1-acyl-sn-glycerol-3-phosphate acyltransferase [Deltaproteobacteria bacterium]
MRQFAKLGHGVLRRWHRAEVRGLDALPPGPVLFVGNHNAATATPDTWIALGALHAAHGVDGVPFGLAHAVVMRAPLLGSLMTRLGAVPACHEQALELLEAGRSVLVYPGGDAEAMRPYRDRDRLRFSGRQGYIRLALRAGVPIVPLVAAGAHASLFILSDLAWLARRLGTDRRFRLGVFPIALSLPWGLTVGPLPPYLPWPSRILIEALPAIQLARTGPEAAADPAWVDACARQVETTMQDALTRLAAERATLG